MKYADKSRDSLVLQKIKNAEPLTMNKPCIDVAAAAIVDSHQRVLLALRAAHRHQGNLWEFPGGKLEPGETAEHALVREIEEELGIRPTRWRPLITVEHEYADKAVRLHVFRVSAWQGEPHGREGQPLQWASSTQLDTLQFPAANLPIVRALQLPELLLITPEPGTHHDAFLERLQHSCRHWQRQHHLGVQLRAHALDDAAYRDLALRCHTLLSALDVPLILNRASDVIDDLPCEGWHLSSTALRETGNTLALAEATATRPRWLTAAVHNEQELAAATQLGADALLISPVQHTATHPGTAALGWPAFAALSRRAGRPCYALGGLGAADLSRAWEHGAQGIAGIRGLMDVVNA